MQTLRIFVSSPGDVAHERRRVDRIVERLNGEFAGIARLEAIRWETAFYQAHATFQAQIPASTECDLVVAIFHGRLGTELPPDFERQPDGTPYPSGTAYEVLTAIRARRENPFPDVFVFRHAEPPLVRLDDPKAGEVHDQWQRLKGFFETWFVTEQGHFQAAFHNFESTDDFEQQLERLLRHWLEEKVLHGRAVAWPIETKGSPFRGLAAFGAKHASVFFGRSRDISRAVDAWKEAAERGTAFLLVVGASGAGKSSLARAGLVPRLTVPGVVAQVDLWRVAVLRPSEMPGGPISSLAARLLDGPAAIPEAESGRPPALPELAESDFRTPAELGELLRHGSAAAVKPLIRTLDRLGEAARVHQGYERSVRIDLVVLVDQLDELFSADVDAAERGAFTALLGSLAASGRVWVVATLRADLYERFLAEPALLALKTSGAAYDLAPPGAAELGEIVRQPAAAAELVFEADQASGETLDERLLRDADRADMLPLLQLALNRLFDNRVVVDGETRLTITAYNELGGLAGVIDREAERAVAGLGENELAALPRLLRRLVVPAHGVVGSDAGRLTVRTIPLAEAIPDAASRRLVEALVEARILLTAGEGAAAGVHLTHQRVLRDWVRLRELIAADAEFFRVRDEVEEQRRRWHAAGEAPELLLPRGLPLAEAEAIAARFGEEILPETRSFIAASAHRARRRQRLLAATAVVFALVAVIATAAGILAWTQRQYALDQQARAEAERGRAEQQRTRAEAETARATENEHRANAALRTAKRETAQTLAAQVQLALRQPNERQALSTAVKAGNVERDVLEPGDKAVSEPALLGALGAAREVLHIKGASQNWWLPYEFLDDGTLVYADARSGVIAVSLQHAPKVVAQVRFPEPRVVTNMALAAPRRIAAVASGNSLLVIDLQKLQIAATFDFPERINALDVDTTSNRAVVAVGNGIAIVDLDKLRTPSVVPVPDAGETKAGQVRFVRAGAAVLVSYGVKLAEFDPATGVFTPLSGELSGAGMAVDSATLASVIGDGRIPFVRIVPDIGNSPRFFTVAPMELKSFGQPDDSGQALPRTDSDMEFVGISPLDQENTGNFTATAVVLSRSREERQEFQVHYLSGSKDHLMLTEQGRLYPPFEAVTVAPGDLSSQKPSSCKISPRASYMACQYWNKDLQGVVVWQLLGGAHGFERVAERRAASSGLWTETAGGLLATTDTGLVRVVSGTEKSVAPLSDDWRLTGIEGRHVAAVSPKAGQGQVFRLAGGGRLEPALAPLPAAEITLIERTPRALVRAADRISIVDLDGGQPLWTVPIAGARAAVVSTDGKKVATVDARAAYGIDAESGRILSSVPIAMGENSAAAIDSAAARVAYVGKDGKVDVIELASGSTQTVNLDSAATVLAWTRDGKRLLVGDADGNVSVWDGSGVARLLVTTPLAGSFRANAWPEQPAQGTVVQLALSHDGNRLAVIRQDLPTVDLHDLNDGRRLTQLTAPWTTLKIPAHVSFAADDAIVTAWAVHPMAKDKPRYVTVHQIPRNFDELLAAATDRLMALEAVWSAAGPPAQSR